MPAKQDKLLKYAFAEQGERTPFSIDPDGAGLVSMAQGFTNRYSKNPEADGEYILRDVFNQMQFIISDAIKNMQRNGGVFWSRDNADSIGGYKAGERVLVWRDLTTNQIVESPRTAGGDYLMTDTVQLISMRDQNLTSPFDNYALFKDWLIDDGQPLLSLKTYTQAQNGEFYKVPSGYLDFGASDVATRTYNYSDFKRIEYLKNQNRLPVYFIDNNNGTFKLLDVRGYFQRMWSNGSNIDSGRAFNTLQSDRTRNIVGSGSGNGSFFLNSNYSSSEPINNIVGTGIFKTTKTGNKRAVYYTIVNDSNLSGGIIKMDLSLGTTVGADVAPYNYSVKCFIKV